MAERGSAGSHRRAEQASPAGPTAPLSDSGPESQSFVARHLTLRSVRGRTAILSFESRLAELAARCGQGGETDNLVFFLNTPGALLKTSWLVYGLDDAGALRFAVLLHEYRAGPLGLRIFITSDATGRRNVLAVPGMRELASALTARHLLSNGAHAIHIAFSRTHQMDRHRPFVDAGDKARDLREILGMRSSPDKNTHRGRWALREHQLRAYLPLASSFDATLAGIGQRTRANLRYSRRRAEADLGSIFVPQAAVTRDEFIAFDRSCHYPVGDQAAGWRYDSLRRIRSPFLSGIKGGDGRWLALVGGRRQSGNAEIDWQMNRNDLPAYSLGTVLRGYLIEHEIQLGSRRLYVEGGTPQAIGLSFATEQVAEVTVIRRSLYGRLITRFAPRLAPADNYLAQALGQTDLVWNSF